MGPKRSRVSVSKKPRDILTPEMADRRGGPPSLDTNIFICSTDDTSTEDTPANLKQKTLTMATKVMKCEERNSFMGELMGQRLGTRDVENFIYKQERLRRGEGGRGVKK